MTTAALAVGLVGICFALLAVKVIFVKGGAFKGACGGLQAGEADCPACPSAGQCEQSGVQEPKSSKAMFSRGTPSSSSMSRQACNIRGGPQR